MEVSYIYPLRSILNLNSEHFPIFLEKLGLTAGATDEITRSKIALALAQRTRANDDNIILSRSPLTTYKYFPELLAITSLDDPRSTKLRHRLSTLGINPASDRVQLMEQTVNLLLSDPINYPITQASDIDRVLGLSELSPITVPILIGLPEIFVGSKNSGLESIYQQLTDLTGYYLVFLRVPGKLVPLNVAKETSILARQVSTLIEDIKFRAAIIILEDNMTQSMINLAGSIQDTALAMETQLVADENSAGLFVFVAKMNISLDNKFGTMIIKGQTTDLNIDFKIRTIVNKTEYDISYPIKIGLGTLSKVTVSKSEQGIMSIFRYPLDQIKTIRTTAFNVAMAVNPIYTNRQLVQFNRYFSLIE